MVDLLLFALRWPGALLVGALVAVALALALQAQDAPPWSDATLFGVLALGALAAIATQVLLSAIAAHRARARDRDKAARGTGDEP